MGHLIKTVRLAASALVAAIFVLPLLSSGALAADDPKFTVFNCTGCHSSAGDTSAAPESIPLAGERNVPAGAVIGNHSKGSTHVSSGGKTDCVKCHGAGVDAYGTSHREGVVNMAADIDGGYYDRNMNDINDDPMSFTQANSPSTGTCRSTYCHGTDSPQWGDNASGLNCQSCHKANTTLTGAHHVHWNTPQPATGRETTNFSNSTDYIYGCGVCHNVNPDGEHVDKSNAGALVNNGYTVDIRFGGIANKNGISATYANGGVSTAIGDYTYWLNGNCTSVYCHSDGRETPAVYNNPSWKDTGYTCTSCHGNAAASASMSLSNNHNLHAGTDAQNYTCDNCHSSTLANNSNLTRHASMTSTHVNGQRDVVFTSQGFSTDHYSFAANSASYNGAYCSNVYCHSNVQNPLTGTGSPTAYGMPTWGNTIGCGDAGACHKGRSGDETSMDSGSHAGHLASGLACTDCHFGGGPSNMGNHVDGYITLIMNSTYGGSYTQGPEDVSGSGYATCTTVYCHSSGDADGLTYRTATWGGSLDCSGCHGNQSGTAQPTYANTGPGTVTANSHQAHVGSSNIKCNICHMLTTSDTNVPPTTVNVAGGQHLDKQMDVNIVTMYGKTGTYDSGAETCSTTYCHGNPASPAWGGSTTCKTCHEATQSGLSGLHSYHYNSATPPTAATDGNNHTGSGYVFGCKACHRVVDHSQGPADNTGPVFQDAEIGGEKLVLSNYAQGGSSTADARGFKYTVDGTCVTVCHSKKGVTGSGTDTPNVSGASLSWEGTVNSPNCGSCHDATGDPATKHNMHLNTYTQNTFITCNSCHSVTAFNNTTIAGASGRDNHPNASKDVIFNASVGGTWDSGGNDCSNTYCHSDGQTSAGNVNPNAVDWLTGPTPDCTGCHDVAGTVTNTGSHYFHVKDNSADHVETAPAASFGCPTCHMATAQSNTLINTVNGDVYHVNSWATIQFDPNYTNLDSTSYNGVRADYPNYVSETNRPAVAASAYGKCAEITCHNDGVDIWRQVLPRTGREPIMWGTASKCNRCHGNTEHSGSDLRKAMPSYPSELNNTLTYKPNAHDPHRDMRAAISADTIDCDMCHNTVMNNVMDSENPAVVFKNQALHGADSYSVQAGSTFVDGGNASGNSAVAFTYTLALQPNSSTCDNVSCHPDGITGNSVKWNSSYQCTDCHKVDMDNATSFHHVMDTTAMADRSYPATAPTSSNTHASRKCTMCHVDHELFSPRLNAASSGRAFNLRTDIALAPAAVGNVTNKDFDASLTNGGICLSCHKDPLTKATAERKLDGDTTTPALSKPNFDASAHNYTFNTSMKQDSSSFQGNCVKCHNSKNGETETMQSTTRSQLGTHDGISNRLLAGLGSTATEGYAENFCFRCHSETDDAIGGTLKTATANDWYGSVSNMNTESTDLYDQFAKTGNSHPIKSATYAGRHDAVETSSTSFSGTQRHVECEDCHNPHEAQASNPLYGATGVVPPTATLGATRTAASFVFNTAVTDPDKEYQVCYKCHSSWAGAGTGQDVSEAFNTANQGFHWVENDFGAPKASTTYGDFRLTGNGNAYVMMPRYNGYTSAQLRGVKMRCTDCHGSDNFNTAGVADGMHGSTNAQFLKVPAGSTYTAWNATVTYTNNTAWCFNCHDISTANTGFYGTANLHSSKHNGRPCQNCHLAIPHGNTENGAAAQRKRLLQATTFTEGIDTMNRPYPEDHTVVTLGCT